MFQPVLDNLSAALSELVVRTVGTCRWAWHRGSPQRQWQGFFLFKIQQVLGYIPRISIWHQFGSAYSRKGRFRACRRMAVFVGE